MVDQHAAALHDAVGEMGIAWRQEGIRSATQLERFIRAHAQQMDAGPTVPARDIGQTTRQQIYRHMPGHVQEYLIHRSP
eukprot:11197239-Lingulodinium_polyedra.AAC.1